MKRGEIYWVEINPTRGSEVYGKGENGLRPCLIVSPDVLNEKTNTLIVVPLTSVIKDFPTRVNIEAKKTSQAMIEQVRTIDKERIRNFIKSVSESEINKCLDILRKLFS